MDDRPEIYRPLKPRVTARIDRKVAKAAQGVSEKVGMGSLAEFWAYTTLVTHPDLKKATRELSNDFRKPREYEGRSQQDALAAAAEMGLLVGSLIVQDVLPTYKYPKYATYESERLTILRSELHIMGYDLEDTLSRDGSKYVDYLAKDRNTSQILSVALPGEIEADERKADIYQNGIGYMLGYGLTYLTQLAFTKTLPYVRSDEANMNTMADRLAILASDDLQASN